MGRPTKYGEELGKAICAELELGCSRQTASELHGINRATFNEWAGKEPDWIGRFPAFTRNVQHAMAIAKRRATVAIVKSIQNGDVASAWRYLAMQERAEWRESQDININHTGEITFQSAIEKVAKAEGLDLADVLAEAEMIVAGKLR